MIQNTPAYAELRRLSRGSLGVVKFNARLDFVEVLRIYAQQITPVGKSIYEIDIDLEPLQIARVVDLERTYDRYVRQFLIYWDLHRADIDRSWIAVTGYYWAYFGARVLLSAVGRGARAFAGVPGLPSGSYSIVEKASPYVGRATLELTRAGSGGSHKGLWAQLTSLLRNLRAVPGNDSRTLLLLSTVEALIDNRPTLSQARNDVNYSLDPAAPLVKAWVSEVDTCDDSDALARHLVGTLPTHLPQRAELVALATGELTRLLYADYLSATSRPDRRPALAREQQVKSTRVGEGSPVLRWL